MRILAGILGAFLAVSAVAAPFSFQTPEQFIMAEDQALTNELWLVTAAADIRGSIEDDLFAVGGTLLVAGNMGRDVWALGKEVDFTGRAAGHTRLAGSVLDIRGTANGNLMALGRSVSMAAGSEVNGDAVLVGEDVVVEGRIQGRTQIFAKRLTLSGRFESTVRVYAEDIVVHPGTEIRGDLEYTAPRDLILDQRVLLSGQLIRKEPLATPAASLRETISMQLLLFSAAMLVALPFLALLPAYAGRSVRLLRQSAWKCALAGFAAFALFSMAILILPFTIVGIPLSAVLLLTFLLLLYLSKFILALALGGWILRRRGPLSFWRAVSTLAFGLVLLYVLVSLPALGLAAWLLTLCLGLGSLVLAAILPSPEEHAAPPPLPAPGTFPPAPPPLPPSTETPQH